MKKFNKKKGFTLIELIVVIAIIGILAAIAIPRFTGFQDNARIKATLADARNIATAVEALTTDEKEFVSSTTTDTSAKYNEAEIMGYVGKALGGQLTLTVVDDSVTTFTYVKKFADNYFTVTYTLSSGAFTGPSKTTATSWTAATGYDGTLE